VEDMKKAIELDPKNPETYGEIAGVYYKMKKYPQAAEYYQKKIENSKRKDELDLFYLAKALYFSRDYVKSDSAFAQCPSYTESHFWRGQCNFKMDSLEAPVGLANPHFEKFIVDVGIDSVNVEANKKNLIQSYAYFGFFHYTQKNYDCSKVAWLKVQELDLLNEKARVALEDKDIKAAPGTCVLIMMPELKE